MRVTRHLILEEPDPYTELVKAGKDVERNPTDGQKEAGNYAKGHVWIQGFHIAIENPKGSIRSGKDGNGKEWRVRMPCYYGYIKGTEGKDKDHIDVYVGPDPEAETVYVVDQVKGKEFDEHKIMLGFRTKEEALECYDAAFSDGKGPERRGAVTGMSLDDLREWLGNGDTKKPVAKYREPVGESTKEMILQSGPDEAAADEFFQAYIEAALWSSSDERDVPLQNNYGMKDIAPETLHKLRENCDNFFAQAYVKILEHPTAQRWGDRWSQAGHDFWLTHNGHGAGFWDGDWPDPLGDELTELSKQFGEIWLYVGDDGMIYG